jgi:hypothetical protein
MVKNSGRGGIIAVGTEGAAVPQGFRPRVDNRVGIVNEATSSSIEMSRVALMDSVAVSPGGFAVRIVRVVRRQAVAAASLRPLWIMHSSSSLIRKVFASVRRTHPQSAVPA